MHSNVNMQAEMGFEEEDMPAEEGQELEVMVEDDDEFRVTVDGKEMSIHDVTEEDEDLMTNEERTTMCACSCALTCACGCIFVCMCSRALLSIKCAI